MQIFQLDVYRPRSNDSLLRKIREFLDWHLVRVNPKRMWVCCDCSNKIFVKELLRSQRFETSSKTYLSRIILVPNMNLGSFRFRNGLLRKETNKLKLMGSYWNHKDSISRNIFAVSPAGSTGEHTLCCSCLSHANVLFLTRYAFLSLMEIDLYLAKWLWSYGRVKFVCVLKQSLLQWLPVYKDTFTFFVEPNYSEVIANRPRSFTLHFQAESVKTVYKSQNIHYTVMVLQNGIWSLAYRVQLYFWWTNLSNSERQTWKRRSLRYWFKLAYVQPFPVSPLCVIAELHF